MDRYSDFLEPVSLDADDVAVESEPEDEDASEEADEAEEDSWAFGFASDVVEGAAVVPLAPDVRWSVL